MTSGAKVYITGRRKSSKLNYYCEPVLIEGLGIEALEKAAKSHNPSEGGQIIPYLAPLR